VQPILLKNAKIWASRAPRDTNVANRLTIQRAYIDGEPLRMDGGRISLPDLVAVRKSVYLAVSVVQIGTEGYGMVFRVAGKIIHRAQSRSPEHVRHPLFVELLNRQRDLFRPTLISGIYLINKRWIP
jgi:hypothetical protein